MACSLPLRSLNHCSRICQDVAATSRFYRDVLGFVEIQRPSNFDFEGAWLFGFGFGIHLIGGQPAQRSSCITPRADHLSFDADSLEEVEACLVKLNVEYVRQTIVEDGILVSQLFFHDPDNNMIEVCDCHQLPITPLVPAAAAAAAAVTACAKPSTPAAAPADVTASAWSQPDQEQPSTPCQAQAHPLPSVLVSPAPTRPASPAAALVDCSPFTAPAPSANQPTYCSARSSSEQGYVSSSHPGGTPGGHDDNDATAPTGAHLEAQLLAMMLITTGSTSTSNRTHPPATSSHPGCTTAAYLDRAGEEHLPALVSTRTVSLTRKLVPALSTLAERRWQEQLARTDLHPRAQCRDASMLWQVLRASCSLQGNLPQTLA